MLPDQCSEAVESFSHVGIAECQMHVHACPDDDHDAFLLASCRFTSAGLLPSGAKTRRPSPSSMIAIIPSGGRTRSRKAGERSNLIRHVVGERHRRQLRKEVQDSDGYTRRPWMAG
jgi:hypothetical protein